MKQSNWLLGIGIVIAVIIVAGSIWFGFTSDQPDNTVIKDSESTSVQSISTVVLQPISKFSKLLIRL